MQCYLRNCFSHILYTYCTVYIFQVLWLLWILWAVYCIVKDRDSLQFYVEKCYFLIVWLFAHEMFPTVNLSTSLLGKQCEGPFEVFIFSVECSNEVFLSILYLFQSFVAPLPTSVKHIVAKIYKVNEILGFGLYLELHKLSKIEKCQFSTASTRPQPEKKSTRMWLGILGVYDLKQEQWFLIVLIAQVRLYHCEGLKYPVRTKSDWKKQGSSSKWGITMEMNQLCLNCLPWPFLFCHRLFRRNGSTMLHSLELSAMCSSTVLNTIDRLSCFVLILENLVAVGALAQIQ